MVKPWCPPDARTSGRVALAAPLDVVFDEYDVLRPDVLFFRAERRHLIRPDAVTRHAPDVAVEVLSPSATITATTASPLRTSPSTCRRSNGWRRAASTAQFDRQEPAWHTFFPDDGEEAGVAHAAPSLDTVGEPGP